MSGALGVPSTRPPTSIWLAQQGVRFTNAYAACHVCSPTRASILTGKYPARLKLTDWLPGRRDFSFQRLYRTFAVASICRTEETTLAEALKEAGAPTEPSANGTSGSVPSSPEGAWFFEHVPHDWPNGAPNGTYYVPYRLQGSGKGRREKHLTDRLTTGAVDRVQPGGALLPVSRSLCSPRPDSRTSGPRRCDRDRLTQRPREGGPAFILEGNPDDVNPLSPEAGGLARDPEYAGYRGVAGGPSRSSSTRTMSNSPAWLRRWTRVRPVAQQA